jgi:hypothetical protein
MITRSLVVALALLTMSLSARASPEGKRDFVLALQRAVRDDDRAWIASRVHLPAMYFGKRAGDAHAIRDNAWLIAHFATIFNAATKAVILKQDPNDVFENGQGAMVGDGNVWFRDFGGLDADPHVDRYAIITINAK